MLLVYSRWLLENTFSCFYGVYSVSKKSGRDTGDNGGLPGSRHGSNHDGGTLHYMTDTCYGNTGLSERRKVKEGESICLCT